MTVLKQEPENEAILESQSAEIFKLPAVNLKSESDCQRNAYKSVFHGLAIAELIFGCICMVLGIVSVSSPAQTPKIGEGIWCGIWTVVSGALTFARRASGDSSRCLINLHFAFSVVGIVFSTILLLLSVTFMLMGFGELFHIFYIQSIFAFASLALLISTASVSYWVDSFQKVKNDSAKSETFDHSGCKAQKFSASAMPSVHCDSQPVALSAPFKENLENHIQNIKPPNEYFASVNDLKRNNEL